MLYELNERDEFTYLDVGWDEFARANDAPDVTGEVVLGRPLWQFIADETTDQLYREIIRRARRGRRVTFGFRCDAPGRRRYMGMTVEGREGGGVRFVTTTLKEEARPPQPLLDRRAARGDGLLRVCGWCRRVDISGGGWAEVEDAVAALGLFERPELPTLTHGMCADCFTSVTAAAAARPGAAASSRLG